jgi:oxaloacetate decarboxylase alpha subunit
MNYIKAIEAGVDIIDTATAPLAFGNSQPATETIVAAIKDTPYDSKLDLDKLHEIAEYFDRVREKRGFKRGVTSLAHMRIFSHQVPGGMISNLDSQLEQQKALDRLDEVLEEIPRVRAEVGYPPLVTPLSQIVGTQAVLNVLTGKRWGVIPDEMKAYVSGSYGKPPGPMNPEIEKLILGEKKPIECRPADLIKEKFEDFALEIGDLARNDEDVLSYALFPKVVRKYLEEHAGPEEAVFMMGEEIKMVREDDVMDIDQIKELIKLIDTSKDVSEVVVEEDGVKITVRKGSPVLVDAPASGGSQPAVAEEEKAHNYREIKAPMVGTFYCASAPDAAPFVEIGDAIEVGQTLCILEAMKLMNEITAEEKGIIRDIRVENAHPVEYGQVLFLFEPVE